MKIVVCDYGRGNVRSVLGALRRLNVHGTVSDDPDAVWKADVSVLPGVGSARAAMDRLRARGVDEALRLRVAEGRPTLGICLGLQLALDHSEEDGGVACLGIVEGRAVRIGRGRVPRMGWADVEPYASAFYFAHSYVAETPCATALSEGLIAEARSGSFIGVQFHPEKSGPAGERFLERCLTLV